MEKQPIATTQLNDIAKKHFGNNSLSGVEFLRAAVRYLDSRIEVDNENKTPTQLLKDFAKKLEEL